MYFIELRKVHTALTKFLTYLEVGESWESKIVGLLTLGSAALTLYNFSYPDKERHDHFETIIKVAHYYNVLYLFLLFGTKYLEISLDPYDVLTSYLVKNWDTISSKVPATSDSIYSYRDITEDELGALSEMAVEAWGEENLSLDERFNLFRRWYLARRDIFSFLIFIDENGTEQKIGYVSVLPLKNDQHYEGNISQFKIKGDNISQGPAKYIYYQAVYIKQSYRKNEQVMTMLLSSLLGKVAVFMETEKETILYAEQFTAKGGKLLRKMGFAENGTSSLEGHKHYALPLDLNKIEPRRMYRATKTLNVIKRIRSLMQRDAVIPSSASATGGSV